MRHLALDCFFRQKQQHARTMATTPATTPITTAYGKRLPSTGSFSTTCCSRRMQSRRICVALSHPCNNTARSTWAPGLPAANTSAAYSFEPRFHRCGSRSESNRNSTGARLYEIGSMSISYALR